MHASTEAMVLGGLWLWKQRDSWVFHPSELKLSFLHGLINGPPWTDEIIQNRIEKGYLKNEVALYTVPKFQDLIFYLIKKKYVQPEVVVQKALDYSNFRLMKAVLRKYSVKNVLKLVLHAYEHMLWNIMDLLLIYLELSNKDMEFLLSHAKYDGLSEYLLWTAHIQSDFETMQLAAKLGNLYIVKKILTGSSAQPPNDKTLVLAAASGNVHLVKYLCNKFRIEPEVSALINAANHDIVLYFVDVLNVPMYDGFLLALCEKGMLESVRYILEKRSFYVDFDIVTVSARSGNVELLKYLICDRGFAESISSLEVAAKHGRLEAFKFLSIERKIPVSSEILLSACSSGNVELLTYLINDLHYTPNSPNVEAVIQSGSWEGFLYLINLPNTEFSINNLNAACIGGNGLIFNYLIEKYDLTPDLSCLNEALRNGHRDIVFHIYKLYDYLFLEAGQETFLAAIQGQMLDVVEFFLNDFREDSEQYLAKMVFDNPYKVIYSQKEKDLSTESGSVDDDLDSSGSSISPPLDPHWKPQDSEALKQASLRIVEDKTRKDYYFEKLFKNNRNYPSVCKDITISAPEAVDEADDWDENESIEDNYGRDKTCYLRRSLVREMNPVEVTDEALKMFLAKGNSKFLELLSEINRNWIDFQDVAYFSGNIEAVRYLTEVEEIYPNKYQLKLAAASGNVELVKYVLKTRKVVPESDSFDFAAIQGQINVILFVLERKHLKVDNLIIDLAKESGNHRLVAILSRKKPNIVSVIEYFHRKKTAQYFKSSHFAIWYIHKINVRISKFCDLKTIIDCSNFIPINGN